VNLLKAIATADGSDLQMQVGMFGVTALVEKLQVRLVGRHNTDQHIRRMMFAKMGTKAALPALNRFHSVPPFDTLESPNRRKVASDFRPSGSGILKE
jgi:hypothetical protein